jgi:hypothetical protein
VKAIFLIVSLVALTCIGKFGLLVIRMILEMPSKIDEK